MLKIIFSILLTSITAFSFSQSINHEKKKEYDTTFNNKWAKILFNSIIVANQAIDINGKKYVSPDLHSYSYGFAFRYKLNPSISFKSGLGIQISTPIFLNQYSNEFKYEFSRTNKNNLSSYYLISYLLPLDFEYKFNNSPFYLNGGLLYSYNLSHNRNKASIYYKPIESGLRAGVGTIVNLKRKFLKFEIIYSKGNNIFRETTRDDLKITKITNDMAYFNFIIEPKFYLKRKGKNNTKRFTLKSIFGEKNIKTE